VGQRASCNDLSPNSGTLGASRATPRIYYDEFLYFSTRKAHYDQKNSCRAEHNRCPAARGVEGAQPAETQGVTNRGTNTARSELHRQVYNNKGLRSLTRKAYSDKRQSYRARGGG
jgi:hypothetical protein